MTTRHHHPHGTFIHRSERQARFAFAKRCGSLVLTGERKPMVVHRHLYLRPGSRLLPAMMLIALSLAGSATCAASTIVSQMTYDAGDHVATVTDPRGLVTTYTRDGLGQLWQQASPDTGTTSFAYDSDGRRSSMTRADGTQTTYAYDDLNRVTSVSASGQTQTFTYDSCTHGIGRLCVDSDATGATFYSYTPEGWVAGRGFSIGATTYAIGYSHDAMGHVTTVNYPDGNQASYTYAKGVVSTVSLTVNGNVVNGATAITYRPADMAMATWTSSNGLSNTLGYDDDGRLTAIWVPGVQSLGFTYDKADRLTQITNGVDNALTQNFGYDDQSRLLSVYASADNESYQYDANGNRLMQTGTTNAVSATSNRLMSSGAKQYGYDARGNTTTVNGATQYQYDAFNRMSAAAGMAYYVNPEGQRLRKTGTPGTTYFAPDQGGSLLAEDDNGVWVDYVWLNGRLIGRMAGGQVDAIHDDQVGRPEAVTDATQAVVWRARNLAFTRDVTVANLTLNLGFPGQYYDAETGNWNNGFRDYDSALGRYIESDPIGLVGGVNTYAYVGNNPLSNTDPLGLCNQDRCKQLSDKINQLRNELAKRYGDLQADELGLPLTGPMSIGGHQQQFENKQTQLRKLRKDFDTQGCNGGLPADVWDFATKDAPSPSNNNHVHAPNSSVRNALIGVGVFIGGTMVFLGNAASEVF